MISRDRRRLARCVRRLEELRYWRNARETPIREWIFTARDVARTLNLGEEWPVVELPATAEERGVRFCAGGSTQPIS